MKKHPEISSRFASQIPDIILLMQYQKLHQELIFQFFILRNDSQLLGLSLNARFGGGGGNPLLEPLKKGEIDEYKYQIIWALVDCYQSLFTLIQMNWEILEVQLPEYGEDLIDLNSLENAKTLFLRLLKEYYDDSFRRCAEDGYTFTPSHANERAEIMRRMVGAIDTGVELNPISQKIRQKAGLPTHAHKYFFLFHAVLGICSEVKITHHYYQNLWLSLSRLTEIHEYWSSQHRGETRARAVKWENGRMFVGVKGGYKPVTQLYTTFSA